MAAELIGVARCPLCGGRARLSLAKTNLPVMTMNCCNAQLFARSDRSDLLMRGLLHAPGEVAPEPVATPASAPAPIVTPVRAETPEPVRTEKPRATLFGGLMQW